MRSADEQRALVALITEVLAFYRQDVSRFALQVWEQACEGFEVEQIRRALGKHATDPERGHFPPKPADLVRELAGTQTDRSLLAWGKLYEAMRRVGAYESVVFDDAAIHAAVEDIGGWVTVCRSTVDELPHLQRRFCASYRAVSAAGAPAGYPPRLIGEHEAANALNGRRVSPPVLIGNPARAAEVMRLGAAGQRLQITTSAQSIELPVPELLQ